MALSQYTSPTFDYPSIVESIRRSRIASRLGLASSLVLTVCALGTESKLFSTLLYTGALTTAIAARTASEQLAESDRDAIDIRAIGTSSRDQQLYRSMTAPNPQIETSSIIPLLLDQEASEVAQSAESVAVDVPLYSLADIAGENHTAVIGASGSGKSFLTQWLVREYFPAESDVIALDTDASPTEWPGLKVVGRGCNLNQIEGQMNSDLRTLQHRTDLRKAGKDVGTEQVRIIEEFPTVAAMVEDAMKERNAAAKAEGEPLETSNTANAWLKGLLRRGRKYKMKVVLVSQEFEVKALGISGEGGLRQAFSVIYLGPTAFSKLDNIRDKDLRERLRAWLSQQTRPALVESGGQWFGCEIPEITEAYAPNDADSAIDVESHAAKKANSGGASTTVAAESVEPSKTLHTSTQQLLNENWTKTMIINQIWKLGGSQWATKGAPLWEELEKKYGTFSF